MSDALHPSYDVILIGTSLPLTLISSAAARDGLSVLHVDSQDCYGGADGTVAVKDLVDSHDQQRESAGEAADVADDGSSGVIHDEAGWHEAVRRWQAATASASSSTSSYDFIPLRHNPPSFTPHASSSSSESSSQSTYKGYHADLRSHALYSNGSMVKQMIRSKVEQYLEFVPVDWLYVLTDENGRHNPNQHNGTNDHAGIDSSQRRIEWQQVPATRSAVFTSTLLTLEEKYALMAVIQLAVKMVDDEATDQQLTPPSVATNASDNTVDDDSLPPWMSRPFHEFLAARGLTPRAQQYAEYALALSPYHHQLTTAAGLQAIKLFATSAGRYSTGSLLYPMYGIGEISSAFARSASVHGATFMLRTSPLCIAHSKAANSEQRSVAGVVLPDKQFIAAKHVVVERRFLTENHHAQPTPATIPTNAHTTSAPNLRACSWFYRTVIVDRPLHTAANDDAISDAVKLFVVPPDHTSIRNQHPIHILQLPQTTHMTPTANTHCVLEISTPYRDDVDKEVEKFVSACCRLPLDDDAQAPSAGGGTQSEASNWPTTLFSASHVISHQQLSDHLAYSTRNLHTVPDAYHQHNVSEDAVSSAGGIQNAIRSDLKDATSIGLSSTNNASDIMTTPKELSAQDDQLDELDAILAV